MALAKILGRVPPQGERRHAAACRRIQDDCGNASGAFVARATGHPARLQPRVPGRVSAVACDMRGPGMRHVCDERTQRHDPLHPAAYGDIEDRRGVSAPAPLGFHTPKQQQPRTTRRQLPGPERTARPADSALPFSAQAHHRPELRKIAEVLRVDRGQGRRHELTNQVAERAGGRLSGIDPSPNATTIVAS